MNDNERNGVEIVQKLDAIVRNKYANNPAALAEWICEPHRTRVTSRRGRGFNSSAANGARLNATTYSGADKLRTQ